MSVFITSFTSNLLLTTRTGFVAVAHTITVLGSFLQTERSQALADKSLSEAGQSGKANGRHHEVY